MVPSILEAIPTLREKIRTDPFFQETLEALAGALMVAGLVGALIEFAASLHWSLAVLLALACAAFAIWFSRLISQALTSISMVFVFLVLSVLLGAVACAGLSYVLHNEGWAIYTSPHQL